MEPFLSIPQTAQALGTSAVRIEAAAQLGALPAFAAGSELYVDPREAEEWLGLVRAHNEREQRLEEIKRVLAPASGSRLRALLQRGVRLAGLGSGAA